MQNVWKVSRLFTHCVCMISGGFYEPALGCGRVVAGSWWMLVIIVYGIYTGNLIAFLSITLLKLPFETLEQMTAQTDYVYGTEEGLVHQMLFQVPFVAYRCNTFCFQLLCIIMRFGVFPCVLYFDV